ncbi:MAG: DUF4190 domain-containing protein [Anaerolineae bacterium]|nr:MAG: DUF4190 domain-containing protein [Anaerolineae bacterium]
MTSLSEPPKVSSLAIVSLVASILGLTLLPFTASVVAIVSGHLARREIAVSNGALRGDEFAISGLILGYFALLITAVVFFIGLGILLILAAFLIFTLSPYHIPAQTLLFAALCL